MTMRDFQKDKTIIRELAKQYREIAESPKHVRMRQRFRDSNDLKIVRPPLIMEEIPWHEMNLNGELTCVCENDALRGMEWHFRVELFRERHFACDNFIEPCWPVSKSYSSTGNGLSAQEEIIAVDDRNHIVSHHYEDVLEDERALEAWHAPVITAHPEEDAKNLAFAEEVLGDILPVELRGHGIYYAPWDQIARLRGVEPILMDIYDRPEYLHKIIGLYTKGMESEMDQMEALGLYDPRGLSLHCTPGEVTLPQPSDIGAYGCRDLWFRTMAQMFSSISPAAHYEFDVQYSVPLAQRCAYTYYGCCEPLSDRIDVIKSYPNLRKIGVSPWADVEASAEQIGGNYVLSRKPNPANVAIKTDPAQIRAEITETVKLCQKYGCPCDITLKDISTVGYRPENLIVWAKTAAEVLDQYYGEA